MNRIRRIITPAILSIAAAGSILAGSAVALAPAAAPAAVVASASYIHPGYVYHG